MDKRGVSGDAVMFGLVFFMMLLIGVGIVWGNALFFGAEYDLRQVDSDVLSLRIKECVSSEEIDWFVKDEFYEKCSLSKKVLEEKRYMIKVCSDLSNKGCIIEKNPEFSLGSDFQACVFEGGKENKAFPKCSFVNVGDLLIVTGSNQYRSEDG